MRRVTIALLVAAAAAFGAFASEPSSDVPALGSFHEVIFPIWHQAWPAKDVDLLVKYAPDVRAGVAAIAKAELPGMLRERRPAWDTGLAAFKEAAAEYDAAAAARDGQKLLAAAEKLHARYEGLVRIVRPAVKELDVFHSALYSLYHESLPKNDVKALCAAAPTLKERAAALAGAKLSQRQAPKQAAYDQARAGLVAAVDGLAKSCSAPKDDAVKAAFENVHTAYQSLDAIFQ